MAKGEDEGKENAEQDFADEFGKLRDRAKAAGVRTTKVVFAAALTELLNAADGVLEGLEGSRRKAKPKAKKKPSGA